MDAAAKAEKKKNCTVHSNYFATQTCAKSRTFASKCKLHALRLCAAQAHMQRLNLDPRHTSWSRPYKDTDRERERATQTDRQTDGPRFTETDRQTEFHTHQKSVCISMYIQIRNMCSAKCYKNRRINACFMTGHKASPFVSVSLVFHSFHRHTSQVFARSAC